MCKFLPQKSRPAKLSSRGAAATTIHWRYFSTNNTLPTFSPVLRKILHKRPGTSGQLCCDSPGSPPCREQSFSPKGTIVRTGRTESGILYVPSVIFQELHNFMFLSLCTLRIDKSIRNMYNKARNQRSTAEAQMRANPADFKQKGAKTDGRYGTRTVRTDCRGSLRSKTEAHHKRDASPV